MARARIRVQRSFYLLVALLILLFLLQLNQWLPGVWKGGGEGGFRAAGDLGLRSPDAASQDPQPAPDAADPGAVEAPRLPPRDWPPKRGLVVQVVGPDGAAATGWRLGTGDRGPLDIAPEGGEGLLRDDSVFDQGFRVHLDGRELRHRRGLDLPATKYVVHLPGEGLPRPRQPAPVTLEVRDPVSGAPVEGARVRWDDGDLPGEATTDAEGRAELPAGDGTPFRVRIDKPGHVARDDVAVRPRAAGPQRVDLPETFRRDLVVRWADRRPATVTDWKVHAADGRVLATREAGGTPMGAKIPLRIPANERAGAHLAIRAAGTDVDGYQVSVPLDGLDDEVILPQPRTLRIVVRDVRGEPIAEATVRIVRERGEAGTDAPLPAQHMRTNRLGELHVSLAPGQEVQVSVQKDTLGPAARRLSAVDGSDTLEFVLEPGVMIPVRVRSEHAPLGFAAFEGRASLNGVRFRQQRSLRQDPGTPSRVGPFPPGPVELYVGAREHAWSAAVVDARPAMGAVEVELARAWPLRFVIADPHGVPVPGAEVSLAASDEGTPLVIPPSARALRADAQGRVGVRLGPGPARVALPDRRYEARITAPGFRTQVLRGLRPGGALHFVTLVPVP